MKSESAENIIWWVLEVIKRQLQIQAYGLVNVITLDFENLIGKYSESPSIRDVVSVIIKLERGWKVLEIVEKRSKSQEYGLEFEWDNVIYFLLEINKLEFDKLYRESIRKNKINSRLRNPCVLPVR